MLAKRDLTKKTLAYANCMGIMPTTIKINSANTRWGSCSAKKSINYSWRLIMANDEVIDYVVVHELAHIIELNHSERFWKVAENQMPDYNKRKRQLKELQQRLCGEEWK
jgi:predicted metal-dependent hydrolase